MTFVKNIKKHFLVPFFQKKKKKGYHPDIILKNLIFIEYFTFQVPLKLNTAHLI